MFIYMQIVPQWSRAKIINSGNILRTFNLPISIRSCLIAIAMPPDYNYDCNNFVYVSNTSSTISFNGTPDHEGISHMIFICL